MKYNIMIGGKRELWKFVKLLNFIVIFVIKELLTLLKRGFFFNIIIYQEPSAALCAALFGPPDEPMPCCSKSKTAPSPARSDTASMVDRMRDDLAMGSDEEMFETPNEDCLDILYEDDEETKE